MTILSDINDRIAERKGWTWDTETAYLLTKPPVPFRVLAMNEPHEYETTRWVNPEGKPAVCPDFTGTLEGMSGLLWELGPQWAWGPWYGGWNNQPNVWTCFEKNHQVLDEGRESHSFFSSKDRPGDCVGKAWLSIFGKDSEC